MKKTTDTSPKRCIAFLLACVCVISLFITLIASLNDSIHPSLSPSKSSQLDHRLTDRTNSLLYPDGDIQTIPETWDIPEYKAWLLIPGTSIDYPVVQSTDASFYLNHDVYGNQDPYGSIFLDSDCSLDDPVITIHGHHMMNDDQMFTPLLLYIEADYLAQHPLIEFNENKYEILGCMQIDTTTQNDRIYMYYLNDYDDSHRIKKISEIFTEAKIEVPQLSNNDRFLLLSTCWNTDGMRWIVFSRLL